MSIEESIRESIAKHLGELTDVKSDNDEMSIEALKQDNKNLRSMIDRNIGKLDCLYKRNKIDRDDIDNLSNKVLITNKTTSDSIQTLNERISNLGPSYREATRAINQRISNLASRVSANSYDSRINSKISGLSASHGILSDRLSTIDARFSRIENTILKLDLENLIKREAEVQMKKAFSKLLEGMFNLQEEK